MIKHQPDSPDDSEPRILPFRRPGALPVRPDRFAEQMLRIAEVDDGGTDDMDEPPATRPMLGVVRAEEGISEEPADGTPPEGPAESPNLRDIPYDAYAGYMDDLDLGVHPPAPLPPRKMSRARYEDWIRTAPAETMAVLAGEVRHDGHAGMDHAG